MGFISLVRERGKGGVFGNCGRNSSHLSSSFYSSAAKRLLKIVMPYKVLCLFEGGDTWFGLGWDDPLLIGFIA